MIVIIICVIGILTLAPFMVFVNVFFAVMDYRLQKHEKGGKLAIGITPYRDSIALNHILAFGISGLLTILVYQIQKTPLVLSGYLCLVFYVVIIPTAEMLTRIAARAREPDIQFKKFLWMKR